MNASILRRFLRTRPERKLPTPRLEKRLDVLILGPPNAGKSVLLNTLVRSKLAATSRKRHTTRGEIVGAFNHRNVQLVFYDTPGYVRSAEADSKGVKTLRSFTSSSASRQADVALLVMDAAKDIGLAQQDMFAELVRTALSKSAMEVILVLNKVDLVVPKTRLLDTTRKLVSLINGVKLGPEGAEKAQLDATTFMISAQQNDGIIDLKNYLISLSRPKEWVIPKDKGNTLLTPQERVEQIVLEMLLDHTHEEIPYVADIECLSLKPAAPGSTTRLRIDVNIIVDTGSQERIIVGHQGRTLVKIRASAVEVLEEILGKDVLLFLWVKSREGKNDQNL